MEIFAVLAAAISGFWYFLYSQNKKINKMEKEKLVIELEKKSIEVTNDLKTMSDTELADNIHDLLKRDKH